MGEVAKPTIDDMCEDFEGALSQMADHVIAEVDRETAGMNEIQLADYWLANARKHISELKDIEARGGFVPECIMERAEEVAARRRDRVQSVQQARSQAIDDCIKVLAEYSQINHVGSVVSRLEALKNQSHEKGSSR